MDKDTEYTHPSYGMISISHRSGSPKLFHSALDHHYNYVTIAIKTARLFRSDTGDRLYGPMHGDIAEVDLSAAQFAELLTTANIGLGVACTLRNVGNKRIEPPPNIDSQPENLRTEFKARASEFSKRILAETAEVKELLKNKATISKGDREKIASVLGQVAQELEQNMPFLVEMYQEATEKVTGAAKAEVEGFLVGAIRQAGLAALAAGKVEIVPPQLPERTEVVEGDPPLVGPTLRPKLVDAVTQVMQDDTLTIAEIIDRLVEKDWSPSTTHPESYVSFTLKDNKHRFEQVSDGVFKVKR